MPESSAPADDTTVLETWRKYASLWSMPEDERDRAADAVLDAGVNYRDPNVDLHGTAALGAYMTGFRQGFLGHRFRIDDVSSHHGNSLARWTQVDADGNAVTKGTSHALHAADGRMHAITGFFHDRDSA